jgi:hypothetical protein
MMATSWQEYSADVGARFKVGKNCYSLLGLIILNTASSRIRMMIISLISPTSTAFLFSINGAG